MTRFPPEPNGYLHIGHAKAICIDFGMAAEFGGECHLRMDDTNPSKEDEDYVRSIKEDVRWLGFDWGEGFFYASDLFDDLHAFAEELIRCGPQDRHDPTPRRRVGSFRGVLSLTWRYRAVV